MCIIEFYLPLFQGNMDYLSVTWHGFSSLPHNSYDLVCVYIHTQLYGCIMYFFFVSCRRCYRCFCCCCSPIISSVRAGLQYLYIYVHILYMLCGYHKSKRKQLTDEHSQFTHRHLINNSQEICPISVLSSYVYVYVH